MVDQEITFEDINGALRELSRKVNGSISLAFEAREKVASVLNSSNLRSTLTLLQQDIGLRKVLELTK